MLILGLLGCFCGSLSPVERRIEVGGATAEAARDGDLGTADCLAACRAHFSGTVDDCSVVAVGGAWDTGRDTARDSAEEAEDPRAVLACTVLERNMCE